jgi:hypothetical protein
VARREGTSIYAASSQIARGALRTGLAMGNEHVFVYYRQALDDIAAEGLSAYVARVSRPYGRAMLQQFDPENPSLTERLLRGRRDRLSARKARRRRRTRRG